MMLALWVWAQGEPTFDVVSVKPCKLQAGRMQGAGEASPGRLMTGCSLLVDENSLGLIQRAYVRFAGGHVNPFGVLPVQGGPAWLRTEAYQIEAKAQGAASPETMQGPMLQAVLEDRFGLKIRRETREGPVYALTLGKDASRLKPFAEGSCTQMPAAFPPPALPEGQRYCKAIIALLEPAIHAEGSTLAEFAKLLSRVLDRPVVDRTGTQGRFNLDVKFSRDDATPGLRGPLPDGSAAPSDAAAPTIFTAIQEQLGLKLAAAKGPIEVLTIDGVKRPSKN